MAGNNSDPLAAIGDQTYVDFVALPRTGQNSHRNMPAPPLPTSTLTSTTTSTARTIVTHTVFNRSLSNPSASATNNGSGVRSRTVSRMVFVTPRRNTDGDAPPDIPPRPTDPSVIAKGQAALRRMRQMDEDNSENSKSATASGDKAQNGKSSQRKTWSGNSTVARVAIASHTYIPVSSDDLAIKRGDVLEILETDHRWWWYAKNPATGLCGYVPCNHVKYEIPVDHDHGWKVETVLYNKSETGHGGRYLVHSVGNFEARAPEEVSCRKDDIFVVLNDRAAWWFVRHVKTGKEGFVPHVYLKRCTNKCSQEPDEEPLPEGLGVEL